MQVPSNTITPMDGLVCLVILGSLFYTVRIYRIRAKQSQIASSVPEMRQKSGRDETNRSPGEWQPQLFKYPPITPWTDFDVNNTHPLPYRPFKWGPTYNITMGIRSMDFSEWIEIDNRYTHYHAIRTQRVETKGTDVVNTLPPNEEHGVPGGALAARELVNELGEYLIRRYPQVFRVVSRMPAASNDFSWDGLGEIEVIEIVHLGVRYNLQTEDPMKVSGLLTQDDLALMLEGKDGRYYFQAGLVCMAGFWRMKDKIGHPLEHIHEGGQVPVPQYREKLRDSMNRFFYKLRVDKPVIRNNFLIQIVRRDDDPERLSSIDPDEIAWSETIKGSEDHPRKRNHAPNSGSATAVESTPSQSISHDEVGRLRFRTERQSLRRLPRSGAIVFTIRTYIEPVTKLAEEPGVPGRLADAIRSLPPDFADYKGQHRYESAILAYLDGRHQHQLETGVVREGQRDAKYPF